LSQQIPEKALNFCFTSEAQYGTGLCNRTARMAEISGQEQAGTMPHEGLIPVHNLRHTVLAPGGIPLQARLIALAEQYFQVAGQAEGTVEATQRDLACFLNFDVKLCGRDVRRPWYKAVTEAFLNARARGQAPRASNIGTFKPKRLSQAASIRRCKGRATVLGAKRLLAVRRSAPPVAAKASAALPWHSEWFTVCARRPLGPLAWLCARRPGVRRRL
jgi:hypothetical protein